MFKLLLLCAAAVVACNGAATLRGHTATPEKEHDGGPDHRGNNVAATQAETLIAVQAGKSTKSALVAMSSSERFAQLRPWTCCNGKQPELLACRDLPVCV